MTQHLFWQFTVKSYEANAEFTDSREVLNLYRCGTVETAFFKHQITSRFGEVLWTLFIDIFRTVQ